jgi:hypothetical protein
MDWSFLPLLDISFDLEWMGYSAIINLDNNKLTINSADLDEFVRVEGGPDPMLQPMFAK